MYVDCNIIIILSVEYLDLRWVKIQVSPDNNPTESRLIKMTTKMPEKNIPVSSHKSELGYKLKAASQHETGSSDSSQSSKRPRGRPPLVTSKPTKFVAKVPPVAAKSLVTAPSKPILVSQHKAANAPSGNVAHPTSQVKPLSLAGSAPLSAASSHPSQSQVPSSSGTAVDSSTNEAGEQQSKLPRPSASEVTNKLLAVLMVSDPISVAELCKQLPELPRESIQSVLEVLQVLGLIVQMMSSKETGSKSSSANIVYLYALSEFAKFGAPFQITQLQAEMRNNQKTTVEVKSRLEELQVS